MLSPTSSRGARRRYQAGTRALILLVLFAAVELSAIPSPQRGAALGGRGAAAAASLTSASKPRRARKLPSVKRYAPRKPASALTAGRTVIRAPRRIVPIYLPSLAAAPSPLPSGSLSSPSGQSASPHQDNAPPDTGTTQAASGASASASPGAVDPDTELQRLLDETEKIDPAAKDAPTRLRHVLMELIRIQREQQRKIASLGTGRSSRATASGSRKRSRKKSVSTASAASPAAPADGSSAATTEASSTGETAGTGGTAAAAGVFFGKRGLKKVHRAGCVFGERIHAEDRIYFKTVAAAIAAGYEPCKTCRPADK